ncbi:ribonuclease HII [Calditerricola yamamurae]
MDMQSWSVAAIVRWLHEQKELDPDTLRRLAEDKRAGVRRAVAQWQRKKAQEAALRARWEAMTAWERRLWAEGFTRIAGIDEVGRGPLAGPVVAAAVILPPDAYLPGLKDSKKLTAQQRLELDEAIRRTALAVGIGLATVEEIDELNIYHATRLAMRRAVEQLVPAPDALLLDAMTLPDLAIRQEAVVKGDACSVSIAAASVVAKVARDRMMEAAALLYPQYGFERNAGYATPEHLAALERYGPCPLHRRSFARVQAAQLAMEWL